MSIVTKNKLESWANTVSSKSTLPYLISRLIRATTPPSTKLNMSWGNSGLRVKYAPGKGALIN